MKSRAELDRFFRAALLAAVGRSRWLLLVFVIFVVLLEVVANLIYDSVVLAQPLDRTRAAHAAALIGVLVVTAGLIFLLDLLLVRSPPHGDGPEVIRIAPHPGLIWLLSPGNPDPLLRVMRYHTNREAPSRDRLRHCWLILSEHPAMEGTYAALPQEMERWGIPDVDLHPIYLPQTGIKETYQAVRRIYEDEVDACGLRADQVVTDLTGGLKVMTAGALLACLPSAGNVGPIEYLISTRDPISGEPIEGSERPMEVELTFLPPERGPRKEE